MAGAPNVLVARLRTLGLKFMVLSGLMLGVSGLVAWQLRSAIGAVPAYSAMWV